MKTLLLILGLMTAMMAQAQPRLVKGKVIYYGDPAWTVFSSKFEVIGFDGDGLLLREWKPAAVTSTAIGSSVNGKRIQVGTKTVKNYTGRFIEMINYPYMGKAGIRDDLVESMYPWLMIRTGSKSVNGMEYPVYDLGVPYTPPPVDPVPLFKKALEDAQKTDAPASAQYGLAVRFYLVGYGCKPDFEQAVYWLQKADEQNFESASNKLMELANKNKQAADKGIALATGHLEILKPWLQKISAKGNQTATDILNGLKK